MSIQRIGFCCKWLDRVEEVAGKVPAARETNTRSTTVAWLNRQTKDVAVEHLWDIVRHNISSTQSLVKKVGAYDPELRMVRIGSDVLPMYTQPDWGWFYNQPDVRAYAEAGFAEVGRLARALDVRLSFHPGQYCVLASDNDNIVERSIEEFEYHVDMARWMGYGATWHDHGFKINVHLSGRGGADKFIRSLGRLTPEARNLITIENDEMTNGLDCTLAVSKHVALVLDIHHHWINSGEYISPTDSRVRTVIDSWRGTRPVLHYSVSREDILIGHCTRTRPDLAGLLAGGHKKQQLRAHSDFYWNESVNEWAIGFWPEFDIQLESKAKNLAREQFYAQAIQSRVLEDCQTQLDHTADLQAA
jgi:UV DNA damage repair endonuclease